MEDWFLFDGCFLFSGRWGGGWSQERQLPGRSEGEIPAGGGAGGGARRYGGHHVHRWRWVKFFMDQNIMCTAEGGLSFYTAVAGGLSFFFFGSENNIFWIRFGTWIWFYQCCGSGMIYSGSVSSFEFSEFRIQAKVPDPSGSNLY